VDISFFFKGLAVGFSIAAPVGPIGILCIRRTLTKGRAAGLLSGLGAATADGIYGCVAGFGLTFVSGFLISQKLWLGLVGSLFLFYLGIKTFLAQPSNGTASTAGRGLLGCYASTFFLTLTNPVTILAFAAVFTGLGAATEVGGYPDAALLVLGVFTGSALWWFILSGVVSVFRERFSLYSMRWVNRVSGAVITAFGLLALLNLD